MILSNIFPENELTIYENKYCGHMKFLKKAKLQMLLHLAKNKNYNVIEKDLHEEPDSDHPDYYYVYIQNPHFAKLKTQ